MNISAKRRGVWILMVGAVMAVALAANDARAQSEPSFVFDPCAATAAQQLEARRRNGPCRGRR